MAFGGPRGPMTARAAILAVYCALLPHAEPMGIEGVEHAIQRGRPAGRASVAPSSHGHPQERGASGPQFDRRHRLPKKCTSRCSSWQMVQRLRGGILLADTSFSMSDSSDSAEQSWQVQQDGDRQRAGREPYGAFKSNIIAEDTPRPDTQSASPLHQPPRRSPEFAESSEGEGDVASRVQEAARIPMGGGAASLTPLMARQVSRMAASVFKNEISPALKRTGTRFAAVVSPLRVSKLSEVISPLVLGTPRRSMSPDECSSSQSQERARRAPRHQAPANHSAVSRMFGSEPETDAPGASAGTSLVSITGIMTIGRRAGGMLRAYLGTSLHGGAEALQTMDLATASAILVGYLLPGVLYGLRILVWLSLNAVRLVVVVVMDSFSSQADGTSPQERQMPAWKSPTPFPRRTPIPASFRTPFRAAGGCHPHPTGHVQIRATAAATAWRTPPPPYDEHTPRQARSPKQGPLARLASARPKAGAVRLDEDGALSELARQHRKLLQKRDAHTEDAMPPPPAAKAARGGVMPQAEGEVAPSTPPAVEYERLKRREWEKRAQRAEEDAGAPSCTSACAHARGLCMPLQYVTRCDDITCVCVCACACACMCECQTSPTAPATCRPHFGACVVASPGFAQLKTWRWRRRWWR